MGIVEVHGPGRQPGKAAVWVQRPEVRLVDNDTPEARVLRSIGTHTDLYGFHMTLAKHGFGSRKDQIPLFANPVFPSIAARVVARLLEATAEGDTAAMRNTRFTLALLLNYLSPDFSEETRTALRSMPLAAHFSLTRDVDHALPTHTDDLDDRRPWRLSQQAEANFGQALFTGAVMIVNDVFAVPMCGEPAGLCIQTFTAPDGTTFVEGNWYAPIGATANAIIGAFDHGQTAISLQRGAWQLLRGVEGYNDDMVEAILEQIEEPTCRIRGMTPQEYRLKNRRDFS